MDIWCVVCGWSKRNPMQRAVLPKRKTMEIFEYQKNAMATCMPSCDNISYMLLNLVSEVGELAGKIAKTIRKEEMMIVKNHLYAVENWVMQPLETGNESDTKTELEKELGDILWQVAGIASVMGWNLEDVARLNLEKLADRQNRNVIAGDGDNR